MSEESKTRKKPHENIHIVLFSEVDGVCPKCYRSLMRRVGKKHTKVYEVAHIYPWSPHPHEVLLLEGLEKLSDDVDDVSNLIALCRECHKVFDHPRTVEGYLEMVAIKKELSRLAKLKSEMASGVLDNRISQVVIALVEGGGDVFVELSMDVMKVKDKLCDATVASLRVKVSGHVRYFYSFIKERFSDLDRVTPGVSELIYAQVKARFLELKLQGYTQSQIFDAMTAWISVKSSCGDSNDAEVVASFFVQNCEIFP